MAFELGLIATVAVCSWIAVEAILVPRAGRYAPPVVGLVLCSGLWAIGSLLLRGAVGADEWLFGRRILYLGACFIGPTFLWIALHTVRPLWWPRHRTKLAGFFALSAFFYSTTFWPSDGLFIQWHVDGPLDRGPLFAVHTGASWLAVVVGWGYLGRAAVVADADSRPRLIAILVASALPLAGNVLYLSSDLAPTRANLDPTAPLLGLASLVIYFAVIRAGVSVTLPMGRHQVIDHLDLGVVLADSQGRVVDANRTARDFLGDTLDSGMTFDDLMDDARARRTRRLEVTTFPLNGRLGTIGRGAILADRTREDRTERRLRLAARLETVGSMTAGIAHEVNNPLAFIRSNLVQLEKMAFHLADPDSRTELPYSLREVASEAPELVAETRDGIERIARLVEQLRGFARDEASNEHASVHLSSVVPRAIALARAGRPVEAIQVRIGDTPAVRGSEGDLVQIVLNLLLNALQAEGDRGAEPHAVEVEVLCQGEGAAVRVLDRGPGFDADALPQIFDPFFTTKAQGTGLGLSLSFELAQRHQGHLEAANRIDGGAVVILWLPAADFPETDG